VKVEKEKKFTELVDANQGIIFKICRLYTHNQTDLEDLFQEIVLQLWKSFDSFKGDSKFSTWMYRVALNTTITLFKKNERQPKTQEIDVYHVKHQDINENAEKEEKISQLYEAIKKLSEIERALMMLYLEDLPYKDISESLGISEVNARVKMNRAKIKLKEILLKNE